ncbi:MAG: zinc ribbon domain-containing protein [Pseudomonadales bacterium]|nr:zinc ribbon domain-containing protein [Pseudomonadales bacterium]
MPIYEYQCGACDHRLEKLQKMSADPLKDCPSCEKPALKKLVSAAAFRLKGSGWYETDFKTGDKKNALHSADSSESSSSKKSADSASSGGESGKSDASKKKSSTDSKSSGTTSKTTGSASKGSSST